jgi:ABC-type multidrug transport system fused ATPase/permease subunit
VEETSLLIIGLMLAVGRWSIALVLAGFVVVVVSLLLLVLRRRMKAERHAHKMQQAALTGKLRKSNETVRELKGQLQQQENDAVSKPEQANSFADEPICQLIMERVKEGQFKSKVDYWNYKDYALDKEQLMVLRVAADRHFQQFTVRLKKAYPELTKVDLDYCCLYLLGLTDADVAALMQRAYNTVSERNKKLRKVFGNGNALPVTLQGIANGFINI